MARLLFTLLFTFVVASGDLLTCCTNAQNCANSYEKDGCNLNLCVRKDTDIGGQTMPTCACACGQCLDRALARAVLLGKSLDNSVRLHANVLP